MSEQLCYATGPYNIRIWVRPKRRWKSITHHLTEAAAHKYLGNSVENGSPHRYAIFQSNTKVWDSAIPPLGGGSHENN